MATKTGTGVVRTRIENRKAGKVNEKVPNTEIHLGCIAIHVKAILISHVNKSDPMEKIYSQLPFGLNTT